MKKYIIFLFALALTVGITSCSNDDPSSTSIFNTTTSRDSLDLWLLNNYTYPYNVAFKYKWEDIESDKTYNLYRQILPRLLNWLLSSNICGLMPIPKLQVKILLKAMFRVLSFL